MDEQALSKRWWVPTGDKYPGRLEWDDGWTLTIGEGPVRTADDDLGEGIDHEILPVIWGEGGAGEKVTTFGALRMSPAELAPAKWNVVQVWKGAHVESPDLVAVKEVRVSASWLSNWMLRSSGSEVRVDLPDAVVRVADSDRGAGWITIKYKTAQPMDKASRDAWRLPHLEALLSGDRICRPNLELVLEDESVLRSGEPRAGAAAISMSPDDFPSGLGHMIEEWWALCEEIPLVIERWLASHDRQPQISRVGLVVMMLEPLAAYMGLNPEPTTPWKERKARILSQVGEPDAGYVGALLDKEVPRPSLAEKITALLNPVREAMGLSDDESRYIAQSIADLRNELAHHAKSWANEHARYDEMARLGDVGQCVAMYHLWVRLGMEPSTAAAHVGRIYRSGVTWTLPSSEGRGAPFGGARWKHRKKTSK